MSYSTKFEDGSPITDYMATGIAEGFEETDNFKNTIHAWSYLIGTGLAYKLQGFFGRNARNIIEQEAISEDGTILLDLEDI